MERLAGVHVQARSLFLEVCPPIKRPRRIADDEVARARRRRQPRRKREGGEDDLEVMEREMAHNLQGQIQESREVQDPKDSKNSSDPSHPSNQNKMIEDPPGFSFEEHMTTQIEAPDMPFHNDSSQGSSESRRINAKLGEFMINDWSQNLRKIGGDEGLSRAARGSKRSKRKQRSGQEATKVKRVRADVSTYISLDDMLTNDETFISNILDEQPTKRRIDPADLRDYGGEFYQLSLKGNQVVDPIESLLDLAVNKAVLNERNDRSQLGPHFEPSMESFFPDNPEIDLGDQKPYEEDLTYQSQFEPTTDPFLASLTALSFDSSEKVGMRSVEEKTGAPRAKVFEKMLGLVKLGLAEMEQEEPWNFSEIMVKRTGY